MAIFLIFMVSVLAGTIATLLVNILFGLAVWMLIFGGFMLQALRNIPAQPPHKGILTVFGERKEVIKNEGWRFFPLYPWWHGFIKVNVTKVNQDLTPEDIRTPDLAELSIPVSLTWTPDKTVPKNLIEFLNSGGVDGVKEILDDVVAERLRIWAIALTEGPQSWEEAIRAQDEAIEVLIEQITGQELPHDKIKLIRQGNGLQSIPSLGIVLNRLNVGQIKPMGELAKAAESKVKEEQERRGETYEVETDLMKAKQLMEAAKERKEKLSLAEAFQIIMEWKTAREGHGFTIPGISPAIMELAKAFLKRKRR